MNCQHCGQPIPLNAGHCPACGGGEARMRDIKRGAVRGGVIGTALGVVAGVGIVLLFGFDRGPKLAAFVLPFATCATGILFGATRRA